MKNKDNEEAPGKVRKRGAPCGHAARGQPSERAQSSEDDVRCDGEARELRKVREGRRQRDGEELRKGELGWVHVVVRSADHQEARGPKGFLSMSLTPWSIGRGEGPLDSNGALGQMAATWQ